SQKDKVGFINPPCHAPGTVFNQHLTANQAPLSSQDETSTSISNRYGNQPIEVRQGKYTCRYAVKIHGFSQPSSRSDSVSDNFKWNKWEYAVKTMIKAHQAAMLAATIGKLIRDCVNFGNSVGREAHVVVVLYIKQEGEEDLENIREALLKYPNDIEGDEENP
ncbi:hypothetical protein BGZ80_006157, partial [Entomortierella chlamydospora]